MKRESCASLKHCLRGDPAFAAVLVLSFAYPVLLPFARRLGPALLVVAALLAGLSFLRQRGTGEPLPRRPSILAALCLSCLAWAACTLLWTTAPMRGAAAVASGALIFVSGVLLWLSPAPLSTRSRSAWSANGILIASTIIAVDLAIGRPLLSALYTHAEPYRYNMVLVSLVILAWPMLAADPPICATRIGSAFAVLSFAVFTGDSETAKLAMAAGAAAYFAAHLLPRMILLAGLACAVLACGLAMFWVADLGRPLASAFPHFALEGHAAERLAIWSAFSDMALSGFPFGWGVESVASPESTLFYKEASDDVRRSLLKLHPHNNMIQIAVEMGVPGLALASAVGLHCVASLRRLRQRQFTAASALLASTLVITMINAGLWQAWQWSAVVAAVVLLRGETFRA